jgi:hypothetical protein
MTIPTTDWSNKGGTADRSCACGTWKQHWINFSQKTWPDQCSVSNCTSKPTLGGHVINSAVTGERIVPLCDSCNKLSGTFTLKGGVTVPSANKAETCEKKK